MWPVLQVFTPSVRKIHFRVVIPFRLRVIFVIQCPVKLLE